MTKPIPTALYSCRLCHEEYSWPATDLWWSEIYQGWECDECWNSRDENHDEPMGICLATEIEAQERREG